MLYTRETLPLQEIRELPNAPRPKGNPGRKDRPKYKAVVCAFDIETTALKRIRQSIMYIWQLQIGFDITIIGRTWEEFLDVSARIKDALGETKLVTYVHNLSYEFCFLAGIHHFAPEDVFCTEPRNILHADFPPYEFRCSYRLSNMSLDQFTKQMKVAHRKLSGVKFNYNKKRYPWTKLTQEELDYCTYDVIGLVEAVNQLMINEGDTLYSIPMTSTGYVRRDEKKSMKSFNWETMRRMIPDYTLHKYLRRSFRGGNTHANRHFVGQILHDVHSWDMASAYLSGMINKEFPMGKWFVCREDQLNIDFMNDLIGRRHKAVIMKVAFYNIHLKDPRWPVPYLSYDKCDNVILPNDPTIINTRTGKPIEVALDNGRIMCADFLECIINDIDLQIISEEYEWPEGGMIIEYMAHSTYGKLPKQIREVVMDYYNRKTTLKNVRGSEHLYNMNKQKANAIYGGTVMDPIRIQYFFDDDPKSMEKHEGVPYKTGCDYDPDNETLDEYKKRLEEYLESQYDKAVKWPYQAYQWGCWVSAWCRFRLEQGIKCVYDQGQIEKEQTGRIKTHLVYNDTDCIKFVGDADISLLNAPYIEESKKNGAFAVDPKGKTHYLGVYEYEGTYPEFITWGAKKYVYRDEESEIRQTVAGTGDTWHITIAGVGKQAGGRELERRGGIRALMPDEFGRPHFVFREAGGVDAVYNDDPKIKEYKVEGRTLKITRNVYLEPHSYTLSVTDDFSWIVGHPDYWRTLIDSDPYFIV